MPSLEVAVISLPTSLDRRQKVADSLRDAGLTWRFFDGKTAEQCSLPHIPDMAAIARGYYLTPQELGCFSSHLACLREFVARGASAAEYMLVLEDDVWIDVNFEFKFVPKLMQYLAIDYLKLYSRYLTRCRFLGKVGHRGLYRFLVPSYGTQAYIVSGAAAQRLVKDISRIDRPIDDEIERYWAHGLPVYALFPYPLVERNTISTVPKGFVAGAPTAKVPKLRHWRAIWREKLRRELRNVRLIGRDRSIRRALLEMPKQESN